MRGADGVKTAVLRKGLAKLSLFQAAAHAHVRIKIKLDTDMLNRSIIIIKAKEPFLSWLSSLPEPENNISLDEINFDNSVYLLPEYPPVSG